MTDDSRALADKAAAHAGVHVATVTSPEEAREASALFAQVWPRPNGEPAALPEMARALAHSGNYVAVARRGQDVVGASLAFRGADEHGALLHSHLTGVRPGLEGRHVGYALKLDQRAWSTDAGIERITWTFDPLVARNAYFNVTKLGADVTRFYVDFYGDLPDDLNAGAATDRCLAVWHVTAPLPSGVASIPDGAVTALSPDAAGLPSIGSRVGEVLLCRVPPDIVDLRHRDPAGAEAWRMALRSVFVDAFGAGMQVTAVTPDGWYVLRRGVRE